MDGYGREVVLRGFNASGEARLAENHGLPFASLGCAEVVFELDFSLTAVSCFAKANHVSCLVYRAFDAGAALRYRVTVSWYRPASFAAWVLAVSFLARSRAA